MIKHMVFRAIIGIALVAVLALGYAATSSDTASAGPPDGKGGKNHEKGGPNLFWD